MITKENVKRFEVMTVFSSGIMEQGDSGEYVSYVDFCKAIAERDAIIADLSE